MGAIPVVQKAKIKTGKVRRVGEGFGFVYEAGTSNSYYFKFSNRDRASIHDRRTVCHGDLLRYTIAEKRDSENRLFVDWWDFAKPVERAKPVELDPPPNPRKYVTRRSGR